ncbi:hydrogenase maturation factor [Rhizobium sp. BK377]|nr:hydrogenase maturation factor [Rhizobium sp. BK377]
MRESERDVTAGGLVTLLLEMAWQLRNC